MKKRFTSAGPDVTPAGYTKKKLCKYNMNSIFLTSTYLALYIIAIVYNTLKQVLLLTESIKTPKDYSRILYQYSYFICYIDPRTNAIVCSL